MTFIKLIIVIVYAVISIIVFLRSLFESIKNNKNSYGDTHFLYPLGIFVWGDGIIIGAFWIISSIISLLLNDFLLFLLIIAVFWAVRSYGEATYWFNQQFSPIIRNPAEKLIGYKYIKKDSIWFMYQVLWQCILIISIIISIYLATLWVKTL